MPFWLVAILLCGVVALASEGLYRGYVRFKRWRTDRRISEYARRFTYDPKTHGAYPGRDIAASACKLGIVRKRAVKNK